MLNTTPAPRRSAALVVLALALVWSLLVAVPVRAQVPGACDANGDGTPSGTTQSLLTSGSDEVASQLAADTGVVLGPAPRAQRWRVSVCVESGPEGEAPTRSVIGSPTTELAPEAGAWETAALAEALDELAPRLYRPGARTSPHVDGVQYIGIEMWLAVDPGAWVPVSAGAGVGEVDVEVLATPSAMVWEFSDGVTRTCEGPGTPYSPGAAGPAPCGRDFERTTEITPVSVSVRIDYELSWSSSLGNTGTSTTAGEANTYELKVGEVQTYLSDGSRPPAPSAGPLADPPSSRPADDEDDCTGIAAVGCVLADGARAVGGFAETVGSFVTGAAFEAAQAVWDFIQGCGDFIVGTASSVLELAQQLPGLIADPAGFVTEKLSVAKDLYAAITAAPGAFASEFFDLETLREEPGRWAGRIGCEIALALLTGAASKRIADLIADSDKLADFTRRFGRDRDGDRNRDRDDDGLGVCARSSFPTGTLVLGADGTTGAIEDIRAGDQVLAFDAANGTWAPRQVTAAWSYLDTDEMATATLVDGSAITATDHHRFYDVGDARFEELEDLKPGDHLATPAGAVEVAEVTTWPSGPTLVWELTVAVDHTFAVLAGEHPVAVHNQSRNKDCGEGDGLRSREERLEELAADPANGGKINKKTRREAEVGLGLEDQGLLPGPITRSPHPGAEFIDADGQAWDVKGFVSDLPPGNRGAFTIEKAIRDLQDEFNAGENVILDTAKMNATDIAVLRAGLEDAGLAERVLWYP